MSDPKDRSTIAATRELLLLAQQGDDQAREALFARYLPRLARWASGRLPLSSRSLLDTNDLVQETLFRSLQSLHSIDAGRPGGFQAYVRRAVLNRITDQVRWASRRSDTGVIANELPDRAPSPLENAVGAEVLERYERALESLSETEREVLHLKIELDVDYEDIAAFTGRPSRDAARMAVRRALENLAEAMDHER